MPSLLDEITTPSDLKTLSDQQLAQLADELRVDVIEAVSRTGGHLGSSLGVVELTVATACRIRHPTGQANLGRGPSMLSP